MTRRTVLAALLCAALFTPFAHALPAQEVDSSLSFKTAFPRPFYQKKYFGVALTGATIVSAGAVSYFTAGAGAPAAATGVSTVASWVAGGGAGSYMAGLSTVGGWFDGNAMLGAAILNGISLGTVGGMSSFTAMTAGQKAIALGGFAATALDGVALVAKPQTRELMFNIDLPVPLDLADKRVRGLAKRQQDTVEKIGALSSDRDELAKNEKSKTASVRNDVPSPKAMDLDRALAGSRAELEQTNRQIETEIARARAENATNGNRLVLAVLAHNLGKTDDFLGLLNRIDVTSDYLNYLRAVGAVHEGDSARAESLLRSASHQAPFAIEPPILLVNLLGANGFAEHEDAISEILEIADSSFDADVYAPRASLVSLHYRVGELALKAERCERALQEFEKAEDQLSMLQKHVSAKEIRRLITVRRANALHCQGKVGEAHDAFASARRNAKDPDRFCTLYVGCARSEPKN